MDRMEIKNQINKMIEVEEGKTKELDRNGGQKRKSKNEKERRIRDAEKRRDTKMVLLNCLIELKIH